jgi:hypothetical protein
VSAVKRPMDEEIVPFRLLDDKSLLKIENDKLRKFKGKKKVPTPDRRTERVTTAPTQVSADAVQFEEGEKRGQMVVLQPTSKNNNKKLRN